LKTAPSGAVFYGWNSKEKSMRLLPVVMMVLGATGCAQLAHDASAPTVTVKNAAQKLMSVDCSGPANDWGVCFGAAGKSCTGGYDVIEKHESPAGNQRLLDFKCK
jgi:hypothetical protein